jgi:hypothetical protein
MLLGKDYVKRLVTLQLLYTSPALFPLAPSVFPQGSVLPLRAGPDLTIHGGHVASLGFPISCVKGETLDLFAITHLENSNPAIFVCVP